MVPQRRNARNGKVQPSETKTVSKQQKLASTTQVNFMKIPVDDLAWVRNQKPPSVLQLFLDCWSSDPYGSRWVQLSTKLKKSAFTAAKKKLSDQGLFLFKPELSIRDGRSTVCWMVTKLHGSRVKEFWIGDSAADTESTAADTESTAADTKSTAADTESTAADTKSTAADTKSTAADSISPQTLTQQGLQKASRSPQDRLINTSLTPQRSYEVYKASIPSEETEPPFGGAAPTSAGMLEEEPPQGATDCAVASDAEEEVSVESFPSLPSQTEATSEKQKNLGEDKCSAAVREKIKAQLGIKAPLKAVPMSAEQKAIYAAEQRALARKLCDEEAHILSAPLDDPWAD